MWIGQLEIVVFMGGRGIRRSGLGGLGHMGNRVGVVWIGSVDIMYGGLRGVATECASWCHQLAGEWYNWCILNGVAVRRHGCCSTGLLASGIG